jgi:formylglycine-generating enzyme required for sulfatase activity
MAWVRGGSFLMGSQDFYPEERPVRRVEVDGFWMDDHPVTVAEFRRFTSATGYVTVAERPLDPAQYPGADPALLKPGALVSHKTKGPVDLRDYTQWWRYIPGARQRPHGPGSTTRGLGEHPVTQVAAEDAEAYAAWAGKELPSEAEWEFAGDQEMTQQHLIGETSVRLEQLQATAADGAAQDAARLRHQVETGPMSGLAPAADRALALADRLCWESLSRGDVAAFTRQARLSAGLGLFGVCARLLPDG